MALAYKELLDLQEYQNATYTQIGEILLDIFQRVNVRKLIYIAGVRL